MKRCFALVVALLLTSAHAAAARECPVAHTGGVFEPLVIVLEFSLPRGIETRVAEAAVAEAHAIWSRYGVDVLLADVHGCQTPSNAVHLAVVPGTQRASRTFAPLGAIHFSGNMPDPVITVFYEDLVDFSGQRALLARRELEYSMGIREQVAGRILGRVLAHELGHYLLRWPLHSKSGLMRATQWTPELSTGATSEFLLSGNEAARLASVLGRM